METVRDSWTDERLDDLSRRMELGFAEVKTELRHEIGSVREEIAAQIGLVREEIGAMNDRLHGMQRMTIQFQGVLIAALVGLIATQL